MNHLELSKRYDELKVIEELKSTTRRQALSSASRGKGFVTTKFPGLDGEFFHPRVAAVLDSIAPKMRPGEDPFEFLARTSKTLTSTLFFNPVVHGLNVAAHATIERGGRNALTYSTYGTAFKRAFRDVRQQGRGYQEALSEGMALQAGPRRVYRELQDRMFSGITELQHSEEGKGLLKRIEKLNGIPPLSLIKSLYRWSGDALWQMGDTMTLASAYERQATHVGEHLAKTSAQIHQTLPSYRIPTEVGLPGKAGAMAGDFLKSAPRAFNNFMPYHENILRGFANMVAKTLFGLKHLGDTEARNDMISEVGKMVSLGVGYELWTHYGDKAAQSITGDPNARIVDPGPLSFLRLVDDAVSGKELNAGAGLRLATGGLFSPSPLTEIGANLLGDTAHTLSPIFKQDEYRKKGADVPWSERLLTAAGSAVNPVERLFEMNSAPNKASQLGNLAGLTTWGRNEKNDERKTKKRGYTGGE